MTAQKIHLHGPVGSKTLCSRDLKTSKLRSTPDAMHASCLICLRVYDYNVAWFWPRGIRKRIPLTGVKLFEDETPPVIVVYEKDGYEVIYEPNEDNIRAMCEAHLFDYDEVMHILVNRSSGVHTIMFVGDDFRKYCETL